MSSSIYYQQTIQRVCFNLRKTTLLLMLNFCFPSTETIGLLGTGAQDVHLDFHTAPELWKTTLSYQVLTRTYRILKNFTVCFDSLPMKTIFQPEEAQLYSSTRLWCCFLLHFMCRFYLMSLLFHRAVGVWHRVVGAPDKGHNSLPWCGKRQLTPLPEGRPPHEETETEPRTCVSDPNSMEMRPA